MKRYYINAALMFLVGSIGAFSAFNHYNSKADSGSEERREISLNSSNIETAMVVMEQLKVSGVSYSAFKKATDRDISPPYVVKDGQVVGTKNSNMIVPYLIVKDDKVVGYKVSLQDAPGGQYKTYNILETADNHYEINDINADFCSNLKTTSDFFSLDKSQCSSHKLIIK